MKQNNLFINKKYNSLKKQINYYNLSDYNKIIVYGENCNNLINLLSIRDIDNIHDNSFFSIFMHKNKFIDEVIIIRLSHLKYLIISKNNKTYKKLKKLSKIYKSTSVSLISKLFIYSLHGNLTSLKKSRNIFPVSHQGYNYKLYVSKNNDTLNSIFPNIFKLSVDNYKLFLYNNNVITNFNIKNKKIRLNLIKALYSADNYNFRCKPQFIKVKQFEATANFIPEKESIIYDTSNNKIGIIHNYFRLSNKRYPFIIGIINKYNDNKYIFIKDKITKQKIILKHRKIYN